MKKLLLSIVLLVSAGTAFGYSLTVKNRTPNEIKIRAIFGGAGVCGKNEFQISPGRTKKKGTGSCCLKTFMVRQTAGDNTKWYFGDPSRTGFGLSCKDNTFTIHRTRDGSLTVER